MEEVNLKEIVKNWYGNIPVLFEMVKCMQDRETSFLGGNVNVRCIKAHKVEFLQKNFDGFRFFENPKNIYVSVATLKQEWCLKPFSFIPDVRRKEYEEFNKSFDTYVTGYDFVMDFDNPNKDKGDLDEGFKVVMSECFEIKEIFDDYKIPYVLKSSGSGIHFEVKSEDTIDLPLKEKVEFFKKLAKAIRDFFDFQTIDLNIYDIRRIWKVPYSLDVKTGNVCLPLTDEQFNTLKLSDLTPEKVLGSVVIKNRGTLRRIGDNKAFMNMCKNFFCIGLEKDELPLPVAEMPEDWDKVDLEKVI